MTNKLPFRDAFGHTVVRNVYGSPSTPPPTDIIGKILYKAPMGVVIFYENILFYSSLILAFGFLIGIYLEGSGTIGCFYR